MEVTFDGERVRFYFLHVIRTNDVDPPIWKALTCGTINKDFKFTMRLWAKSCHFECNNTMGINFCREGGLANDDYTREIRIGNDPDDPNRFTVRLYKGDFTTIQIRDLEEHLVTLIRLSGVEVRTKHDVIYF